jgi:peroxiredoxin
MSPLQPRLDEITQNTRKLVQEERLAIGERAVADLFESGIEDRALKMGDKAPAFALPDAISGKIIRSSDLLSLGPLVIDFFRGRWCPYCVTELETWRDLQPRLRELGGLVVAISPQTLRQSDFTVQQHGIPFPLLRDEACTLAEKFGVAYALTPEMQRYYRSILVNIPFINAGRNVMASADAAQERDWMLPIPATFVVNRDGVITFSEAHADFRVRPEPEEVLAALQRS